MATRPPEGWSTAEWQNRAEILIEAVRRLNTEASRQISIKIESLEDDLEDKLRTHDQIERDFKIMRKLSKRLDELYDLAHLLDKALRDNWLIKHPTEFQAKYDDLLAKYHAIINAKAPTGLAALKLFFDQLHAAVMKIDPLMANFDPRKVGFADGTKTEDGAGAKDYKARHEQSIEDQLAEEAFEDDQSDSSSTLDSHATDIDDDSEDVDPPKKPHKRRSKG